MAAQSSQHNHCTANPEGCICFGDPQSFMQQLWESAYDCL